MDDLHVSLTKKQADALKVYTKNRPGSQFLDLALLERKIRGTQAKAAAEWLGGMTIGIGGVVLGSLVAASPIGWALTIAGAVGAGLGVKGLFTHDRGEEAGVGLFRLQAANDHAHGQDRPNNLDATTRLAFIAEDKNGYVGVLASQNKAPASRSKIGGMRFGHT